MDTHTTSAPATTTAPRHNGGCHCGAVRYEVSLDATHAARCNCSICTMVGATATFAKPAAFRVVRGDESLSTYVWGAKISTRYFCRHCGIHCFARGHLEELGGDYISVNLHTIDGFDPSDVAVVYWDGRHNNWDAGPRPTPWPVAGGIPTASIV